MFLIDGNGGSSVNGLNGSRLGRQGNGDKYFNGKKGCGLSVALPVKPTQHPK
jgi:hypothetical protein